MCEQAVSSPPTVLQLASGDGWRICDEVCGAGPVDRPFEEQHIRCSASAVLSGSFIYRSIAGRVLMSSGSLLLGQQGTAFCCSHEHSHGDRCVAFYLEDSWIEDVAHEVPGVTSVHFGNHRIPPKQALAPLIAEVEAFANASTRAAGEELAFRMTVAALDPTHGASSSREVTRYDERRVSEVLRVIEARTNEPLSVRMLAELLGMSRYHFIRTFRHVTGEAPWRYILGRRLVLATHDLTKSSRNVVDVALASGFSDLSEFNRQFRLQFGMPPARYRALKAGKL